MSKKRSAVWIILHALLFAAAMIVSALLLAGSGHAQTVSWLLVAMWFASSMLLFPESYRSCRCEWAFLKRLFGSGGSR